MIMIDGSVKRNFGFKLQSLHVIEQRYKSKGYGLYILVESCTKNVNYNLVGGGWTSSNDGASTVQEGCESSCYHELTANGGNSCEGSQQLQ